MKPNAMKSLILSGDLMFISGTEFNDSTFCVAPATEKGEIWFAENFGKFATSVNVLKSSFV